MADGLLIKPGAQQEQFGRDRAKETADPIPLGQAFECLEGQQNRGIGMGGKSKLQEHQSGQERIKGHGNQA